MSEHPVFEAKRYLMKLNFIIILTFFLASLNAQNWSKEDSLWLKNVIEGKDTLKLNEETLKAIENGELIIPSWMKGEKNDVQELIKDFESAVKHDSINLSRIPLSMPPAVFALYVLYMDMVDSINAQSSMFLLSEAEKEKLKERIPPGETTIYMGNIGTYAPSGVLFKNLDFNHMLSMVFSSQYRRIQYNRKHANAYKFYYDEDNVRPIKLTEQDKRSINREIQHRRVELKIKLSPNTFNGIDN